VAGDDALLSPSHEQDSCYIAVHDDRKSDWHEYFDAVAAVMADYGGRPHWGKRHALTHVELAKLYPRFEDFRRVRAELDPDGAFGGPYADRVLGAVPAPAR
jgi:L-gulonolactone oxidase